MKQMILFCMLMTIVMKPMQATYKDKESDIEKGFVSVDGSEIEEVDCCCLQMKSPLRLTMNSEDEEDKNFEKGIYCRLKKGKNIFCDVAGAVKAEECPCLPKTVRCRGYKHEINVDVCSCLFCSYLGMVCCYLWY